MTKYRFTSCNEERTYDNPRRYFVKIQTIVFERYNYLYRKQKKNESLEQFHADFVELASRSDYGDREDEWFRDIFTAHLNDDKVAEELIAESRSHKMHKKRQPAGKKGSNRTELRKQIHSEQQQQQH